ncbi:GNAT family N-acetyltransferase [Actinospica robiniae]|uniref:GNAT family N-acetyltransferase n=1 Tax=Actinospica robiniae TaxID=304901 RepID=UPI000416EF06|nr:GNAT family N-acetyltransferase [Actinospica robiniae]
MNSWTTTSRPLTDTDLDLDAALSLVQRDAACPLTPAGYRKKLDAGEYRREWTWLAVDDTSGEALAVAVWWGSPDEAAPASLDAFFVHGSIGTGARRVALAGELIRTAHQHYVAEYGLSTIQIPDYHVFVPGDWRDHPDVVEALGWRVEAVARAGLTDLLERLRYEWTPADGLPLDTSRLTFRAEPDDEVFVDLFARVLAGSLDTTSTAAAAVVGAQAQAREDVVACQTMLVGERTWWRVAQDASGDVVGFAVPSRNLAFPVVGYLGVLPEYRGHGYGDDILRAITRILVDEVDAQTIRADTDLVNRPMAAAFERVGYRNFARRLVYSAPKRAESDPAQ